MAVSVITTRSASSDNRATSRSIGVDADHATAGGSAHGGAPPPSAAWGGAAPKRCAVRRGLLPGDGVRVDRKRRLGTLPAEVEADDGDVVMGGHSAQQVEVARPRAADGREGQLGGDDEDPHRPSLRRWT